MQLPDHHASLMLRRQVASSTSHKRLTQVNTLSQCSQVDTSLQPVENVWSTIVGAL